MEVRGDQSMKQKWTIAIFLILLCIGSMGIYLSYQKKEAHIVQISQDDQVLYEINLLEASDQEIEINYQGRMNIVEIKNHQIRMKKAECPDQICVDSDWLAVSPIVCLPNHLVIQFVDTDKEIDSRT